MRMPGFVGEYAVGPISARGRRGAVHRPTRASTQSYATLAQAPGRECRPDETCIWYQEVCTGEIYPCGINADGTVMWCYGEACQYVCRWCAPGPI